MHPATNSRISLPASVGGYLMGNPCGYGVTVAEKSVRHAADAWYIGYVMASTITAVSALVSFKGY